MSEQQSLDVVRKGYEAFGRGDIDGLLAQLDPNVEWRSPGPEDLPTAGQRRGHAAVQEFFHTLAGLVDIQRFEPKQFIAHDDTVVVIGDNTARVKATGTVLESRFAHVFILRDGKVVSFDEYFDTSALVADLRRAQAST